MPSHKQKNLTQVEISPNQSADEGGLSNLIHDNKRVSYDGVNQQYNNQHPRGHNRVSTQFYGQASKEQLQHYIVEQKLNDNTQPLR